MVRKVVKPATTSLRTVIVLGSKSKSLFSISYDSDKLETKVRNKKHKVPLYIRKVDV